MFNTKNQNFYLNKEGRYDYIKKSSFFAQLLIPTFIIIALFLLSIRIELNLNTMEKATEVQQVQPQYIEKFRNNVAESITQQAPALKGHFSSDDAEAAFFKSTIHDKDIKAFQIAMVKYATSNTSDKNYSETDFAKDMKPSVDKMVDSITAASAKRLNGTGEILSGSDPAGDRQFVYNRIYPIARQFLFDNNDKDTVADMKLYNWIIAIVVILLILTFILWKYILARPLNTKYTRERLGETLIISGIASFIVVFTSGQAFIQKLVGQVDLTGIDAPITEDEVMSAINLMPGAKAPGPAGFTGVFFKKCWPLSRTMSCELFINSATYKRPTYTG